MNKLINRSTIFPLSLVLLTFGVYLTIELYWRVVCVGGGCSYDLMDKILDPIYYTSLSLLTFFTLFLFLPSSYFKQWLIWIFSWGIVASFAIVYNSLHSLEGLFGPFPIFAREIIIMLTVIFWIITILFCAVLWWRGRRETDSKPS